MPTLVDSRRYLTNFDSARTSHVFTDVLVVGSGVAGARTAVEAAQFGQVILISKSTFDESATGYAQGGIAAVLTEGDSTERHYADTLRVGCEMNNPEAVERLVADGPGRVRELVDWGMKLDRNDGGFALTREGGHSVNRIVHANGDQTGVELIRVLKQRVQADSNIRVFQHCFVIDLVTVEGRCAGVITFHKQYGHQLIWAKQTILASGGCGRIWRETTNPSVATGDGLAAVFRAGGRLADMEMMQFHPTTLYVAGSARTLISEAVRGEGAYLVDRDGNRFMQDHHADAELAPRDVVCLAIRKHLVKTRAPCVFLDVRHIRGFRQRFPYISQLCADFQIDLSRDLIPVRPSAHYMIGGVDVAIDGSTAIDGLLACGEVSRTGVHGANRLASNSLLEGLVFGCIAGRTAGERASQSAQQAPIPRVMSENLPSPRTTLDLPDVRNSLRSLMWRNVGVERSGQPLRDTCDILDFWAHYTLDKIFDEPAGWETQNELTVARLIAMSALERTESIGVHNRSDASDHDTNAVSDKETKTGYEVSIKRAAEGTVGKRATRYAKQKIE